MVTSPHWLLPKMAEMATIISNTFWFLKVQTPSHACMRMREFVMGESHTVHHGVSMEHLLGLITPHPHAPTHWFLNGSDPRKQDHMGAGGRVIKTACANKQFNWSRRRPPGLILLYFKLIIHSLIFSPVHFGRAGAPAPWIGQSFGRIIGIP